jgi:hypothetical protein
MRIFRVCLVAAAMAAICTPGKEALAQSATTEFTNQLSSLNDRFVKESAGTRDYQKLREIRSELRKLIPAIRARIEENIKQFQSDESQLISSKSGWLILLNPLPQFNPNAPTVFFPPAIDNSGEGMKNRLDVVKRTVPNTIENLKKTIAQNEEDKRQFDLLATSSSDTESQRAAKARADGLRTILQANQAELDRLQQQQEKLEEAGKAIEGFIKKEQSLENAKKDQLILQKTAVDAEGLLDRLDERAQSILSNDNAQNIFTMISTIAFALLVGTIIFYFFRIANSSDSVKNAIFAGESGIQFVTLFSVVIAIILFGVLRILEGKELSALLGGLSGYILGRGSNRPDTPDLRPPQQPQAAVVPPGDPHRV